MIRNDKKGEDMVLMNGLDYIDLDSVGSTLTKDLLVFPQDISEAPTTASEAEEMLGVHIYDLTDEWWSNLSFVDGCDALEFIELNTYEIIVAGPFSVWKEKIFNLIGCVDMLEVI